jgi:hypothetical protein
MQLVEHGKLVPVRAPACWGQFRVLRQKCGLKFGLICKFMHFLNQCLPAKMALIMSKNVQQIVMISQKAFLNIYNLEWNGVLGEEWSALLRNEDLPLLLSFYAQRIFVYHQENKEAK